MEHNIRDSKSIKIIITILSIGLLVVCAGAYHYYKKDIQLPNILFNKNRKDSGYTGYVKCRVVSNIGFIQLIQLVNIGDLNIYPN